MLKLKPFYFVIVAFVAVVACKASKEQQIIGLWQEVGVKNPQMDSAVDQQMRFLDTVGTHTDSIANLTLYGATNIDTFKKSMRINIDSYKRAQNKSISETWIDFHKNGLAYLHSKDGIDSAKWHFEDDALMIDKEKRKGDGAKIRMQLDLLNDSTLQLHFAEKYLSSTASFRRVKR